LKVKIRQFALWQTPNNFDTPMNNARPFQNHKLRLKASYSLPYKNIMDSRRKPGWWLESTVSLKDWFSSR